MLDGFYTFKACRAIRGMLDGFYTFKACRAIGGKLDGFYTFKACTVMRDMLDLHNTYKARVVVRALCWSEIKPVIKACTERIELPAGTVLVPRQAAIQSLGLSGGRSSGSTLLAVRQSTLRPVTHKYILRVLERNK